MGDYKEAMTRVIQTQMKIIGEEKALKYAGTVNGVNVGPDGTVTSVTGDDLDKLNEVIQAYVKVSPVANDTACQRT